MGQRKGGIIFLKMDGKQLQAKGNFTYSLGKPTREGIAGADGVHGYKETVSVPFIEGEITDSADISADEIAAVTDATVTLELANGKVITLREAWHCNPDGYSGQTEEGNIKCRFEGITGEEVR